MNKPLYQQLQGLMLVTTLLVLLTAFYVQWAQHLEPCPLCLVQRLCAFLVALVCVSNLCLTKRHRFTLVLQMLLALAGLFFASRQLWLQSLPPDHLSSCLPGLDVLIRYFSWHDVIKALLWGSGECSDVSWRLLGLSMPAWAALYFLALFIASGAGYFLINASQKNMRCRP